MAKALTFGEWLTAVKMARKAKDGRETYGGWTKALKREFEQGTTIDGAVAFLLKTEKVLS